ncbi:hypothetical protein N8148_03055 [Gammaproteobacteria bacterium]|nr:hypothetical protein [Gammaproteobacteria bacterium]
MLKRKAKRAVKKAVRKASKAPARGGAVVTRGVRKLHRKMRKVNK